MDGINNNIEVNKKSNNLVIVVLVLIIIALGSFIVYDKVIKKDKCNAPVVKETENDNVDKENKPNNVDESTNEPKIEEITVDKTKVDEQLESYQLPLTYAFEKMLGGKNVTYNQELLDSDAKFNFAWGVAELEKIGKYIPENEVSDDLGNYYIDYNSYKNLYKRLYGVDFDGNLATNRYKYTLQGEILYGSSYTGYTVPVIYLTTNKVVKEGDKYTITVDVLDRETKNKKDCQLQIVALKVGNDYQFKSIMLVK